MFGHPRLNARNIGVRHGAQGGWCGGPILCGPGRVADHLHHVVGLEVALPHDLRHTSNGLAYVQEDVVQPIASLCVAEAVGGVGVRASVDVGYAEVVPIYGDAFRGGVGGHGGEEGHSKGDPGHDTLVNEVLQHDDFS